MSLKSLLTFCASFLAVVTSTAAAAEPGITYDCDTAANHFSELVLPAPAGRFTVSGAVQLNALAAVSKYAPLAHVWISSASQPGQSPASYAGVSVLALPADAEKNATGSPAIQVISFNANGKEDEMLPLTMLAKPGGPQPFSLTFDGRTVAASIASEHRTFTVDAPAPVVRLVCSTGEFLFTDVKIQASQ